MRYSVILPDGDLRREIWEFYISVSVSGSHIWFDGYVVEIRFSTRHVWKRQSIWRRTMSRGNTIVKPAIPAQVEAEMRKYFADAISKVEIVS